MQLGKPLNRVSFEIHLEPLAGTGHDMRQPSIVRYLAHPALAHAQYLGRKPRVDHVENHYCPNHLPLCYYTP